MMTVRDVLARKGPRKLLALDGGGIRGAMTIEVLAGIEDILRKKTGNPHLVLGEWFDYVGGTSTGAIISTCIAIGMPMDNIRSFYESQGPTMFEKSALWNRMRYAYDSEPLAKELQLVFGADTTLGSDALQCLLLLVLRNATTDSPWPLSNNPRAKYNDPARLDCNLNLPLWQLVRASAAAPVFFPPEYVKLGQTEFMFVDGGVTSYNNPAFMLFMMATLAPYQLCWPTGTDKLLLVSVGTGLDPAQSALQSGAPSILDNVRGIPSALMNAAAVQQDLLCRAFGDCRAGEPIDREIGDLRDLAQTRNPQGLPSLFTYARYNVEWTVPALERLGLHGMNPRDLASLDSIDHVAQLQEVGRKLGETVDPRIFEKFVE